MKVTIHTVAIVCLLLPLFIVHKLMYGKEHVPTDFLEASMIGDERLADFEDAVRQADIVDEQRLKDLDEIMENLPLLNFKAVMKTLESGETTDETCSFCKRLVHTARVGLISYNPRELQRMARIACRSLTTSMIAPDVCNGLLDAYLDTLHQIGKALFANNQTSNSNHCALIFGPRCGQITDSLHLWAVEIPPKRTRLPAVPALQPEGSLMKILHLSDFHYDPLYKEGTLADCDHPLCCREVSANEYDSSIEDDNVTVSKLSGRFGDHRHCDMPLETLESLLQDAVNVSNGELSHVYLTGDIPPHDVWQSSKDEYYNITKEIYSILDARFAVRVFPVIGNHEAVPPNLFSTTEGATESQRNTPELYANLAKFWSPWIGDSQRRTIAHGGFYSVTVKPSLKVIALNTNFCYYLNFWLLVDSRDPAGQLKWLVEELLSSESRGQKVHLLGHVPPGSFDCIHSWSTQFLRIVRRFNSTITGQFYGHTHYDEFKVFYDRNRVTPVGAAFIAPSATSYSFVNPAYKLFSYAEHGVLVDAVTRSFNLTEANAQGRIDWQTEYEARNAYGVEDLSPASMDKISRRISTDPETFEKFYGFYHRDSPSEKWRNCTADCRASLACSTRTDVHHDNSTCLTGVDLIKL